MEPKKKGLTISGIMEELDITQEEFSVLFSCRQPQVSRWIKGAHPNQWRIKQILERYHFIKQNPGLVDLAREAILKRKKELYAPVKQ